MTVKKTHKKPAPKQAPLFGEKPEEHLEPAHPDENLALIVDKKSYDRIHKSHNRFAFIRNSKGRSGIRERRGPSWTWSGFDLKKPRRTRKSGCRTTSALKRPDNGREGFADPEEFAAKYMPRVMHEMAPAAHPA